MNKSKLLFFITSFLAILLQSNITLAEEAPNVLYCPEKIECTKDKSVSSCKAFGESLKYFSGIYANGTVKKGVYTLTNVYSYYQYPLTIYSNSSCSYFDGGNGGPELYIGVGGASAIFWEAVLSDATKWHSYGYQAQCNSFPVSSQDCPLKRVPLINIITPSNYQWSFKISVYANGILINDNDWQHYATQFQSKIVSMYQAWDGCSDTGLCTLELMATVNQTLVDAGSIVVDMDNKMNIVDVHAITGFEISHDKQSNSIEIKPTS